MVNYRVCPYCGANLDPDEKCECREKERIIEEKRGFIVCLKMCLLRAHVDLADLKMIDAETIEATYINGAKRQINIACDSEIAIVKDVVNNII